MSKADLMKKFRNSAWLFVFFFGFPGGITLAHADLGGVKGKYSDWLDELLRSKSYEALVKDPSLQNSPEPVSVTCLDTPGDNYWSRAEHARESSSRKAAGRSRGHCILRSALSRLCQNQNRLPRREPNHDLLGKQDPGFFIPNVRYRMIYQLDLGDPNTKIFRYQLEKRGISSKATDSSS